MTVIRDLCGVQAQFMPNAMHSLKIRCSDYNEQTVADGLVKNWTVRGTFTYSQKVIYRFLFVAITERLTVKTNGKVTHFGIGLISGRLLPKGKSTLQAASSPQFQKKRVHEMN